MLKKLACLLALIASPLFAQQTPQAIPLTSGACKLDGTVGCGAGGGGGSGTVTSVAISGGTTGFSFSGSPITTSGTFTLSGTLAIANGGTNLTTYTLGDTLYASAANTLAKLAGNTTTTKKFLMQVGDGVNSAAPTWTATAADFPTLNQSTTGNAATATALAADPGNCLSGNAPLGISANGDAEGCFAVLTGLTGPVTSVGNATAIADGAIALSKLANGTAGNVVTYSAAGAIAVTSTGTAGQVLTSNGAGAAPTFQAAASAGANTALSNLASVAINADLATGAGTAANLTATPPAAITTAQAGINAGISASAAVAGSSVAGAAAGGSVTITAGNAARLTSGNAAGGDVTITGGAGIGTGARGVVKIPGAGTNSVAIGTGVAAAGNTTVAIGNNSSASTVNGVAIGTGSSSSAGAGSAVAIGGSAAASGGSAVAIGVNSVGSGSGAVAVGGDASAASTGAIAIGKSATTTAANQFVSGGSTSSTFWVSDVYFGSGVTDTTAKATVHRGTGGSGADNAGANYTVQPGLATGTAASGDWYVRTGVPRATGSTAQSPTVREMIRAKPTTLTESTATAVVTIPVAAGKIIGGRLLYTVSANDGTDFQATSGEVLYAAVDKGGTVTVTITQSAETSATSAGTLTSTWTGVAHGTNIDLKCNAVSSLTQTVLEVHGQLRSNGDDLTGTVTWN